jgi:predicted transcriptional regulator
MTDGSPLPALDLPSKAELLRSRGVDEVTIAQVLGVSVGAVHRWFELLESDVRGHPVIE